MISASAQLASTSVQSMFCTYRIKKIAQPAWKIAQTRLQVLRVFPTMSMWGLFLPVAMLTFFVPLWAGVSEEEWNVCQGDEEGLAGLPSMPRNKTDFWRSSKIEDFAIYLSQRSWRMQSRGHWEFLLCLPSLVERWCSWSRWKNIFFFFLEKLLSVRDSPPLFRSARTSCSTLG